MKRFFNILALAIVVISLCACNHETGYDGSDDTIKIPIAPQTGDYIFFDIDRISRGNLLEGTLKADFNVIGYRYATDAWEYAKSQASQSRQFSFLNNNGETTTGQMGVFNNHPLTVKYESGVHNYKDSGDIYKDGDLRQWEKNLRYAFFGWYPTTLPLNGKNQNLALEGEPYIYYSLPEGTDAEARRAMVDVLTASDIDTYKAKSMSVVFEMQHRLAALDIHASHMITAKALKDSYSATWGAGIADDAPVTVEVDAVNLKLDNIYKEVDIYLNPDAVILKNDVEYVGHYPSGSYTPTFEFGDIGVSFGYNEEKSLVPREEKLILIPQNDVTATISTITYTVTCGGISQPFTSIHNVDGDYSTEVPLVEGHYAYLLLTITKSGLFVKVEQAPTWEEKKVEYEFE